MQFRLEKRYPLDASVGSAWALLKDVRELAVCMPGAELTDEIDSTRYKGTVKLKVGPAAAAFGGDIEVIGLDEATKSVTLRGNGVDKGGSSASMELTAMVVPGDAPGTCILLGNSEMIVNGKLAQFAGRMMVQVSDMILAQFAQNFAAKASAIDKRHTAAIAPTHSPSRAVAPNTELNAFAILWGLIKNFFAGLFRPRA